MASVVISGDTSGAITLSAPAVAGTTTLTLPATSGTVLQSGTTVTEAQGGTGTTTGYYGFKNRIINGAMVIDQRNAGAAVTPATSNTYVLDRWSNFISQASKYSVQRNAGSVTPPAGFSNYLGATVGASANVTVGASDYFLIVHNIEGFNIADLAWGTASAATVTLSFWVRSSLTGTFGGAVKGSSGTVYSYPFTYTISSANTWEQKTITVVGPTAGTWTSDNTSGIQVVLGLGAGSTYSGTAGAWVSNGNALTATGATNLIATNSATFYITGVQLEKGSTATSFDYRPYGTELALCQRYYGTSAGGIMQTQSPAITSQNIWFKCSMRSTPTMTATTNFGTASCTAYGPESAILTITGAASYANSNWTASSEL